MGAGVLPAAATTTRTNATRNRILQTVLPSSTALARSRTDAVLGAPPLPARVCRRAAAEGGPGERSGGVALPPRRAALLIGGTPRSGCVHLCLISLLRSIRHPPSLPVSFFPIELPRRYRLSRSPPACGPSRGNDADGAGRLPAPSSRRLGNVSLSPTQAEPSRHLGLPAPLCPRTRKLPSGRQRPFLKCILFLTTKAIRVNCRKCSDRVEVESKIFAPHSRDFTMFCFVLCPADI